MNPFFEHQLHQTRRQFFGDAGLRFGGVALGMLAAQSNAFAAASRAAKPPVELMHQPLAGLPHHKPKAKAIIYLHMNGGPSQLDTWDYKPKLAEVLRQRPARRASATTSGITTMTSGQARFPVAPSKFKFTQHGKCGRWVNAELLPHTAEVVDDIAVVKTVHTNAINHDPACTFVMTGSEVPGKPSIGSWLAYGLGSESNDLPAFVVFTPTFPDGSNGQALFTRMWGSGFLPTQFNGVALRGTGDPVLYLQNPDGVTSDDRRTMLDALNKLNRRSFEKFGDPEIATRITQYEMAFRMQTSVPELTDLSPKSRSTSLDMYGPNVEKPGTFAHSALLARRLVERGVRVVQMLHRGWDQHGNLPVQLGNQCKDTDQATAALINDLKQRGLLDDTLVVWGGEFGRTVYSQGKLTQRRLRPRPPSAQLLHVDGRRRHQARASNSARPTTSATTSSKSPVHLNDLNATILHCLGIDHSRFTLQVPRPRPKADRRRRGDGGEGIVGVTALLSRAVLGPVAPWTGRLNRAA